jgi:hypothetical protein
MPQDHRDGRRRGRTALLKRAGRVTAMAALAVCAATAAAYAGDDDNSTMASPGSFYDRMLQIIGVEGGPNIEYSERSPLVVPPTRDLPAPAADRTPAVPDWPKDPDMDRQAKAKVKEKPKPHADYVLDSSRPLRPDELSVPGANTGTRTAGASNGSYNADYPERDYPKSNKSIFSWDFLNPNKTEYATFTGEPARTSLTDPPPGYLTPSPDQPYGVGPEQKKYKVPTVADRVTPQSGSAAGN